MQILFEENELTFDVLTGPLLHEKKILLSVARLDKLHPVVSGNKLFKLHYFLQEAITDKKKTILTFGGAYSNHLAATAYACKAMGLHAIGMVRGGEPAELSHTLEQCRRDGMKLVFLPGEDYAQKDSAAFSMHIQKKYPDALIIPEGGYHPVGAMGAALIMNKIRNREPTHVCTAVGTATTFAGLLTGSQKETIIGIPVLKGMNDLTERISYLTNNRQFFNMDTRDHYHFGGYAKKTDELICFMNRFYQEYNIPLDFVYTGKMMFAVMDMIRKDHFKEGSHIICLHTGGLQGNASLPASTLLF